jgi:hypothetical protein
MITTAYTSSIQGQQAYCLSLVHSKVKRLVRPKQEGDSTSPMHISNSQFSVVISDSESEGEGGKTDSMDSTLAKQRALASEDGEDKDEEIPDSEASSSRHPRGDNRAKCSRGRGSSSLQAGSGGHIIKVSSFKPLPKNNTESSKVKGVHSVPKQQSSSGYVDGNGKGKAKESNSKVERNVEGSPEERKIEKQAPKIFRGVSDSEEEELLFHEPTEHRRSASASLKSTGKEETEASEAPSKDLETSDDKKEGASEETNQETSDSLPQKATEVGENADDFEDDNHIDSVLGLAISSRDSSPAMDSQQYITREEHEKAIQELRKEMKQELDRLKSSIRIETKRLVRTEVKDEIELVQQR